MGIYACDIDGCHLDIIRPFCKYMRKRRGVSLDPSYVIEQDLAKCFKIDWGTLRGWVNDFYATEAFRSLKPDPGVVETIDALHRMGHRPLFMTSRFGNGKAPTLNYAARYFRQYGPEPIFAGGTHPTTKVEECLKRGINLIIEDDSKCALSCEKEGIRTILIARRWNENLAGRNRDGLIERVDLSKVYEHVRRALES